MQVQVLFVERDGSFDHVANVDATTEISGAQDSKEATDWALEYAFRLTQNIEGSWSMGRTIIDGQSIIDNPDFNENVTVVKPLYNGWGHRSSMVGDRMIVNGKTYEVDMIGFKEVEA